MEADVAKRGQRVAQRLPETLVELDHVQVRSAIGKALRENPEPAADLEHDVALVQCRESLDHVEDVAVDEEVLAQLALARRARGYGRARLALRPRARAHHPNTAAALRSMSRSSSSYGTRRVIASARAVVTTLAGSLGLPRTGWGDRYGASVSTSSRCAGIAQRRVAQVLGLGIGGVTGEREPPLIVRETFAIRCIEKQCRITRSPCVRVQQRQRVVLGSAGVDHQRLVGLARELDLGLERALLILARRVVAVVVQAGLADRDALLVAASASSSA